MPRRVLLAEDTAEIRENIAEYLRDEGFEVDVASNGAQAVRIAHAAPPEAAVLDVMMPMMDARALLTEWMQDTELPVQDGRQ